MLKYDVVGEWEVKGDHEYVFIPDQLTKKIISISPPAYLTIEGRIVAVNSHCLGINLMSRALLLCTWLDVFKAIIANSAQSFGLPYIYKETKRYGYAEHVGST